MQKWELIDRDDVPGTRGVMDLMRRGHEWIICVDGRELMSDQMHSSEDALADLATARIGSRPDARILVGGLGMGFTLAAALRGVGPEAEVIVAELVPAVVRWNRTLTGGKAGFPLSDPRAGVHDGDVADAIRGPAGSWDAILLDVDNGPSGLTRESNNWLYSWQGLEACWTALKPDSILAVWSAYDDPSFTRRLSRAGFDVECVGVRSRGKKGGHRHYVWVATRVDRAQKWDPSTR